MFVDLVGSTALSARVDPETMSEVLPRYQSTVHAEATRLDGHIAKYMGDGVLAHLWLAHGKRGRSRAAVRAGLAIVAAVARLNAVGEAVSCRVGIATGLVVVGDLVARVRPGGGGGWRDAKSRLAAPDDS